VEWTSFHTRDDEILVYSVPWAVDMAVRSLLGQCIRYRAWALWGLSSLIWIFDTLYRRVSTIKCILSWRSLLYIKKKKTVKNEKAMWWYKGLELLWIFKLMAKLAVLDLIAQVLRRREDHNSGLSSSWVIAPKKKPQGRTTQIQSRDFFFHSLDYTLFYSKLKK